MTVYILDNGMDYSDHSIYFVESDWPEEAEVIRLLSYAHTSYSLIGVGAIAWRDPGSVESLANNITPYPKTIERIIAADPPVSRRLLAHLYPLWIGLGLTYLAGLDKLANFLASCGHDECLANPDMAADCKASFNAVGAQQ